MSECDNTFRVSSATHNSVARAQPVGFSFSETVNFIENRPGTRKSPCIAIDTYALEAEVEYQGYVTPQTRGTSASLVIVLEQLDGGSTTLTFSNMRNGANSGQGANGSMATYRERFHFDAGNSESLAPIAVS